MLFRSFLGNLNPDSIFHHYKGMPTDADYDALRAAAKRNVEFSARYLGLKIAAIALVEALARATGGDCPVSMLLGDIRSHYGKPDRVEDFLPPAPTDESSLDPKMLDVLEKGRSRESSSDLTVSPLTAYVYRCLGSEGSVQALADARKMFEGKLKPQEFLAGVNHTLVRSLTEACARISVSRRQALLELAQSLQ